MNELRRQHSKKNIVKDLLIIEIKTNVSIRAIDLVWVDNLTVQDVLLDFYRCNMYKMKQHGP